MPVMPSGAPSATIDAATEVDAATEIVPARLVGSSLLRELAVQRRALLDLGRTAHVRPLEALDLTDEGGIRIVRRARELPTVGEVLRRAGGLPWRDAALVVVQASQALHDARRLGLTHGCLSPDHLVITGPAEVRVDGFGVLADLDVALGRAADPLRPPVADDERRFPAQTTDTYVLAALFVALVTARPVDPADPLAGLDGLPPTLLEILDEAMADDPLERPRPGVLAADLVEWATTPPPAPAPARPAAPPPDTAGAPIVLPDPAEVPSPAARPGAHRMPWGKVALGLAGVLFAISVGRVVAGNTATGLPGTPATTPPTTLAPATDAPPATPPPATAPATTAPATTAPATTEAPPTTAPATTAAPAGTAPPETAPPTSARRSSTRRATTTTTADVVVDEAPTTVEEAVPTTQAAPHEREEPAFDGPVAGSEVTADAD
jgi:hypothetical protein